MEEELKQKGKAINQDEYSGANYTTCPVAGNRHTGDGMSNYLRENSHSVQIIFSSIIQSRVRYAEQKALVVDRMTPGDVF